MRHAPHRVDVLTELLIAAIGIPVALITGWFGWKAIKLVNSGSVKTTDAITLWKESSDLRDYLTAQVVGLREQLRITTNQLRDSTASVNDLLHQIRVSQEATAHAREETRLFREEAAQLRRAISDVHQEVRTGNALTMGALADNAESRRIALIPEGERTDAEREHIDTVGIQPRTKEPE